MQYIPSYSDYKYRLKHGIIGPPAEEKVNIMVFRIIYGNTNNIVHHQHRYQFTNLDLANL